jgi:hypothetical protein
MKKNLQIVFYYSYLNYLIAAFLYFSSKALPVGQEGIKAKNLLIKSRQHQSKAWDTTAVVSLHLEETITSGTKRNLVQVDGMQKYFTTTKL